MGGDGDGDGGTREGLGFLFDIYMYRIDATRRGIHVSIFDIHFSATRFHCLTLTCIPLLTNPPRRIEWSKNKQSSDPPLRHPPGGFGGLSRRTGKKPIIAAVDGICMGGGFEIVTPPLSPPPPISTTPLLTPPSAPGRSATPTSPSAPPPPPSPSPNSPSASSPSPAHSRG